MSATESLTRSSDLPDDDERIAACIRAHRLQRKLTLAQLSERSGISVGHLSRLENGGRTPTVRLLLQLARALGVPLGALVGEAPDQDMAYVSRGEDRSRIATADTFLASLTDPSLRALQAVELTLVPGRRGEPAAHAGEEWIYVLSGDVDVEVGDGRSQLTAGDSIHFRADVPHSLHNPGHAAATVLVVNALDAPALHLSY